MSKEIAKAAPSRQPTDATRMAASKSTQRTAEVRPNSGSQPVNADVRRLMIAEAAYFMSEQRGFGAGHEIEDWLLAERQVDAALCTKTAPAKAD